MSRGGARGRGGGRGGATRSFNREQLNSMGILSNEVLPGPVTQPPPLFPTLERKPVPLVPSRDVDYLLILKQDFTDHIQLSPSYVRMPIDKKNVQLNHEIDKLVAQLPVVREKYDWKLFPSELRPKLLAKRVKINNRGEKKVDVERRLSQLEKLEGQKDEDDEQEVKDVENLEDDLELVEDEQDEEMDDGTDYANNYFDNGEDYEDEDDNLDDGPIY